jgi:predicted phosphodiesterase
MTNPFLRFEILKMLQRSGSGLSTSTIIRRLKVKDDSLINQIIDELQRDGYNLTYSNGKWMLSKIAPSLDAINITTDEPFVFGIISDPHVVSKYCREDVINTAYNMFEQRGIKYVISAGNMLDGEFKFNKFEIKCSGVHEQVLYLANMWPKKDIKTLFITGDCHEGWYQSREGLNIGWYIQKMFEDLGRNDMVFIGHIEADLLINDNTKLRVMHPGGGTAYALSYSAQKMAESFQGGDKPHILIMGHYHKFDVNYVREIYSIQPGCLQDQTPFMRKKKLGAHVGFCICSINSRPDGTLSKCNVEWFPFYDKKYHARTKI